MDKIITAEAIMKSNVLTAKVKSSNLSEVGYNAQDEVLEVVFNSGSIYRYAGVPGELFDRFVTADSMGYFLADEVRGKFITVRMK